MTSHKQQLDRLHDRISDLVERLTPPKRKVTLTVWRDESPEAARTASFAANPTHRAENIAFGIVSISWVDREDAENRGWA
jgi:hypothetical protein